MVEFPSEQWKDYELLDSGRGEKLERFGRVVMARPEPKALWDKSMAGMGQIGLYQIHSGRRIREGR